MGVTIRNSEISFFYTNIFGCFGGKDLRVEGNVLHDARSEHNIYTCNNNGNTGHQVGTVIQDNVMYAARWNNIHLNTNYCDGCIIRRNILWSSNETGGGTANIAIQSGFKNGDIDSNVLFNYSGYGLLFNTYTDGQAGIGVPSDMTGNTIANNTMVDTARDLIGHNFGGQCLATISVQNTSKVPTVDLGHNFYINNVLVHANSSSPNCGALVAYKQVNEADLDWWTTDTWQNNTMFTPDQAAPLSIGKPGVIDRRREADVRAVRKGRGRVHRQRADRSAAGALRAGGLQGAAALQSAASDGQPGDQCRHDRRARAASRRAPPAAEVAARDGRLRTP